jgi:hypothetical protein
VILDADGLNARNLYVAPTQGAEQVVVCSSAPVLCRWMNALGHCMRKALAIVWGVWRNGQDFNPDWGVGT